MMDRPEGLSDHGESRRACPPRANTTFIAVLHVGSLLGTGLLLAVLAFGLGGGLNTASGQDVGAGAFARMGFDARGIALGNALVADPSADVAPYYNPALAPSVTSQRISASAAALSFDRQLQSVEFVTPIGPTAGVGVNIISAGVNDIDGRNADGVRTETFSSDELAVSLAFGNQFTESVALGAAFTIYQSDIGAEVDEVEAIGVDLGLMVQVTDQLHVAGAVEDLLAKYEWETASINGQSRSDRFPVQLRLGATYTMRDGRVRLMGEFESRFQGRDREVPGRVIPTTVGPQQRTERESFLFQSSRGRVGASVRPLEPVVLRVGVDRLGTGDLDTLKPGAGFGVRQQVGELDVRLSYGMALEPHVRTVLHMGTLELFL